ncbi:MAG: segregation/condensation protein A [Oscillospiraceae bacterium]|jgi:segregation and condensation protein A|nr:segregation/condensation protein A [Oscillospiraceae bacterium]
MDELKFHLDGVVKSKEDFEDFDGPLDLILHLLSKNRVEIKDIKISLILDQFMEYITVREQLDLGVASDFVAMAAQLVYMKTRMLLAIDDDETRAEMEQLIKSLEERSRMEEFGRMKAGAGFMLARSEIGRNIYTRQPEPLPRDTTYRHGHSGDELVRAIEDIKTRTNRKLPPPASSFKGIVGRERYSLSAKITELIQRFIFRPAYTLRSLLRGCRSRSEIVATFLAVLELCRDGQAEITGESNDVIRASAEEMPITN